MTFKLLTLGCKVNSYEIAAVKSAFLKHGYKEDKTNPDIVVINTCSVTEVSDAKSRKIIRQLFLI